MVADVQNKNFSRSGNLKVQLWKFHPKSSHSYKVDNREMVGYGHFAIISKGRYQIPDKDLQRFGVYKLHIQCRYWLCFSCAEVIFLYYLQ